MFAPYNLHIPSCKHSNWGHGVEEGVIAKSLLQRTDKTPNLNALVKSQENILKFNSFSVDKA